MGEIFEHVLPCKPLEWTGERLTTEAGKQVEIEHFHRYMLARQLCRGLDVLDVAAGEGYGSSLLSQTARSVVGIELDSATVAHSARSYKTANLHFIVGDARALPLPNRCVDVVVSFETIEHFYEHDEFMAEVNRVLRPAGRLIISSPERDVYSPVGGPVNPYHIRELNRSEFERLLAKTFAHISMFGQRPMVGSALIEETGNSETERLLTFERRDDRTFEVSGGLPRPIYLLAVAAHVALHGIQGSLYIDSHMIEAPTSTTTVDVLQFKTAVEEITAYTRHVESELKKAHEDGTKLKRAIDVAHEEAADVIAPARAQEIELEQIRRELSQLHSIAKGLRAGLSARDRALAEANRLVDRARAERDAIMHYAESRSAELHEAVMSLQKSQNHRVSLEAVCLGYQTEVELQRQALAAQAQNLQALLSSSSWKMTWPLRRIAGQGTSIRRIARGAVKIVWWILTLQLLDRIFAHQKSRNIVSVDKPAHALVVPPAATAQPSNNSSLKQFDPKSSSSGQARMELISFLASGDRLSFSDTDPYDVSVVVVLWNQAHLALRCLRALHGQIGPAMEIVLVDNASGDDTQELLARLDGVHVLRLETNEGYLAGCNAGAAVATGRTLLLLNSDAFVRAGAIEAALTTLDGNAAIGAVGGRLVMPSGRLQEAGSIIWSDGSTLGYGRGLAPDAGEAMYRREVDYCSGAFLLTRRDIWNELGGFDEAYRPAYYEEADYCMRLREIGMRVVHEPAALIDHFEFGSEATPGEASAAMIERRKYFCAKHAVALKTRHYPPLVALALFARDRVPALTRRLLMIDNEVPLASLGSGYPRACEMLREAVLLGWGVTLFPLHQLEFDWSDAWAELPAEVEILRGWALPRLAEFLHGRRGYYDAMIVSRPDNMDHVGAILRQHPDLLGRTRLVYDAEALFTGREILKAQLAGKPLSEAEIDRRFDTEVAIADVAATIICVNATEANVFRKRQTAPVHVLNYPAAQISAAADYDARSDFLFVGRLMEKETPNWHGLMWFIRECWPLIHASLPWTILTIVGRLHPEHAELSGPGIRLAGPVQQLGPVFARARIFVAPIRFAAGIPLKIIEATAAGLPTIATRLMARQLGWDRTEIAAYDTAGELATAALDLYQDPASWRAMRDAAMVRLASEYSRDQFRTTLAHVLDGPVTHRIEAASIPAMSYPG